jgi:hypothetical protein
VSEIRKTFHINSQVHQANQLKLCISEFISVSVLDSETQVVVSVRVLQLKKYHVAQLSLEI